MLLEDEIVKKYSETQTKLFMSLDEAEVLSRELAHRIQLQIGYSPDNKNLIVAGIANGGLMVAKIVADLLLAPLEIIHVRRQCSGLKRMFSHFKFLVPLIAKVLRLPLIGPLLTRVIDHMNKLETSDSTTGENMKIMQCSVFKDKHVVLIDDCIETGQSIFYAKNILMNGGANSITTGVITLKNLENDPEKADLFAPIIFLNKRIQHYPWSQNNAEYDGFLAWLHNNGIRPWE